jgi:hypothetical protein
MKIIRQNDAKEGRVGLLLLMQDSSPMRRFWFHKFDAKLSSHLLEYLVRANRGITSDTDPDICVIDTPSRRGPDLEAQELARSGQQPDARSDEHDALLRALGFVPPDGHTPALSVEDFGTVPIEEVCRRGLTGEARAVFWSGHFGCACVTAEMRSTVDRLRRRLDLLTVRQFDGCRVLSDVLSVIDCDVQRHDRGSPEFEDHNGPHGQMLRRVLALYAAYDRDVGYVQGMSDLLSILLLQFIPRFSEGWAVFRDGSLHSREEAETFMFWAFAGFLRATQYDRLYCELGTGQAALVEPILPLLASLHRGLWLWLAGTDLLEQRLMFSSIVLFFRRDFGQEEVARIVDAALAFGAPLAFMRLYTAAALIVAYPHLLLTDGMLASSMATIDTLFAKIDPINVITLALLLNAKLPEANRQAIHRELGANRDCENYRPKYLRLMS